MDIKYLNLQKITESFQPELDEALQRVVRKGWFLSGDETRAFEAEFAAFCGSEHWAWPTDWMPSTWRCEA